MTKRLLKFAPYAAAVVGGVMLWAAFPPRCEALNAIIALAPLIVVARLCAPGKSARCGFVFGFAYWLPTLLWMLALSDNNGPWLAVLPGWLGLSAWCAGYSALFAWLDARLWRRCSAASRGDARDALLRTAATFGEAVLWAGCEWVRATLLSGFSWNCLGTAFADMPYFIAPAKFGGVYLVSALVVLFNGVAATLVLRAFPSVSAFPVSPAVRRLRALETAIPLAAILLALWAGKVWKPAAADETVRVSLVQRNAPCTAKKGPRENPYEAFGRLLDVAAAAKPRLVVLAESAFCEFGEARSSRTVAAAASFLEKTGANALIGGADERTDGRVYNVAALYTSTNALPAVYRKQHLVPFGEYIPLDKVFTPLQALSPVGVSLWPGEPVLLYPEGEYGVRLGTLICFEDTVAPLARRAAADGAQALVLVTNDAWFTPDEDGPVSFLRGIETLQHARQTVLRAVETGLPVVRTGNSGVTGVVFPDGRARWLENGDGVPLVDAPGVMTESVPFARVPRLTPYVRLGDVPLLAFFAFAVFVSLLPVRKPDF